MITVLVIGCIVLWNTKGVKWALVLSVIASAIAVLPFMIMTWKSPENSPIIPNTGFFLANLLSFIAAKEWKLEDRLFPGVNVFVCGALVIPWLLR